MSNKTHKLQQDIDKLTMDIKPQRDLWQGIELGIERAEQMTSESSASRRPVRWQYAVAASFSLFAFVGWFMSQQMTTQPGTLDQPTIIELANNMSQQHETQKESLLVSFQDQPALTENWQEQLTELDDAADAIKAALKQDPTNTALLKMLQQVYQQQISLIERVHSPKWRQI